MECHFNRWERLKMLEIRPVKTHTHARTHTHTHTHTTPFTASLYLSVSLPPLISTAELCVISFSSERSSARPWLDKCLRLLPLLQPLHNLIRMRHALTFPACLRVVLSCCFPSCTSLPLLFLHPVAPFPKFHLWALVTRLLAEPLSVASCE